MWALGYCACHRAILRLQHRIAPMLSPARRSRGRFRVNGFAIVTHAVILLLGFLGLTKQLRLPRGRRSATGLVLMGLAMFILWPGLRESAGALVGPVHMLLFGSALWLLIGPDRRRNPPDTNVRR